MFNCLPTGTVNQARRLETLTGVLKDKNIQGDQKVSVHLMITIQKVTSNVQSVHLAQSDCLAADRQGQGDTRLTLTPSVIPNSNYVTMIIYRNCLKYFCVFRVL
jgi:hypothetical protein